MAFPNPQVPLPRLHYTPNPPKKRLGQLVQRRVRADPQAETGAAKVLAQGDEAQADV